MRVVIGTSPFEDAPVAVGPLGELPGEVARAENALEARGYVTTVVDLLGVDEIDYVVNDEGARA